jgi:hypothetical protein
MDNGPVHFRIHGTCAAVPRWATRASSDAIGFVRGPGGALNLVMIDVQGSGSSGNGLAHQLFAFSSDLLASGASIGVALKALDQHLISLRQGKVLASTLIASVDARADMLRLASAGDHVVGVARGGSLDTSTLRSAPSGAMPEGDIEAMEIPLHRDVRVVLPNDGVARSENELGYLYCTIRESNHLAADAFLGAAIARDNLRPGSDMAVACIGLLDPGQADRIEYAAVTQSSARRQEG